MHLIGWLQATLLGLFSVVSVQVDSDHLYVFSTEVKSANAMSTCITVSQTLHAHSITHKSKTLPQFWHARKQNHRSGHKSGHKSL